MAWYSIIIVILALVVGWRLANALRRVYQRCLILRYFYKKGATSILTLTHPEALGRKMQIEDIRLRVSELVQRGRLAPKNYYADGGGRQKVYQITDAGRRQIWR